MIRLRQNPSRSCPFEAESLEGFFCFLATEETSTEKGAGDEEITRASVGAFLD
jgi:hypothetical protein